MSRTKTPEYRAWRQMLYVARQEGVEYGPWLDFDTWLRDVGPRPQARLGERYTFRRIDVERPWSPTNVHWTVDQPRAGFRPPSLIPPPKGSVR